MKLENLPDVAFEVGRLFVDNGFEIALVGGSVRDLVLGREPKDLDFTTNARPEQIKSLVKDWSDVMWTAGEKYGTIAFRKRGYVLEVTTYRSEEYVDGSRKPVVAFGDSIEDDLLRRDFTLNAMALKLPDGELVDPANGISALGQGVLETPGEPESIFADDPLRMIRAIRFSAQYGFTISDEAGMAMYAMRHQIGIVAHERIREEFVKALSSPRPRQAVTDLVEYGLAVYVLPEFEKLDHMQSPKHKDVYEHSLKVLENAVALETDGPDFVLRFAALMHDVGKPDTRRFETGRVTFWNHDAVGARLVRHRMRTMAFNKNDVEAVSKLVELHMRFYGYGEQSWSDAAVRRYATDAGDQLSRLIALTRADVTTKNRNKAKRISRLCDDLKKRVEELSQEEELKKLRPHLNGNEVMELLDLKPGPDVGEATRFLLDHRIENGPIERSEAVEILYAWWRNR